uniref:Uncharacterized protein n=2 Tax=Brassica oleracea TaxID=3712 RepID=A0A0D3ABY2_BRAOL|nr:unnamed protein product [Brassica oleracea]
MEITFRFNETDRAAFTINVPSGGGFTVNFNPVGQLVPPAGGRLNNNGSRVHPQASGGFTINFNPIGLPVPPANGGLTLTEPMFIILLLVASKRNVNLKTLNTLIPL